MKIHVLFVIADCNSGIPLVLFTLFNALAVSSRSSRTKVKTFSVHETSVASVIDNRVIIGKISNIFVSDK